MGDDPMIQRLKQIPRWAWILFGGVLVFGGLNALSHQITEKPSFTVKAHGMTYECWDATEPVAEALIGHMVMCESVDDG